VTFPELHTPRLAVSVPLSWWPLNRPLIWRIFFTVSTRTTTWPVNAGHLVVRDIQIDHDRMVAELLVGRAVVVAGA